MVLDMIKDIATSIDTIKHSEDATKLVYYRQNAINDHRPKLKIHKMALKLRF